MDPLRRRARVGVVVVTAVDPAAQQLLVTVHTDQLPAAADNTVRYRPQQWKGLLPMAIAWGGGVLVRDRLARLE